MKVDLELEEFDWIYDHTLSAKWKYPVAERLFAKAEAVRVRQREDQHWTVQS